MSETLTDEAVQPHAVVLEEQRGHVLLLTLNRPQARNAVDVRVHHALGSALERADADPGVRVVVLTGAGEAFCAGADLKALARGESLAPRDARERAWGFAGFVAHHISTPTIVAVNGHALGGGTEIVLAADLAVASSEASFGLPEVKRGIAAGAGGVFRLPEQVPRKLALELILTGATITADRALELGLVNRVVDPCRVLDEALALAEVVAANAPLAVQASKRMALGMRDGVPAGERDAWELCMTELKVLMRTRDAAEGVSAFADRRTPRWEAR